MRASVFGVSYLLKPSVIVILITFNCLCVCLWGEEQPAQIDKVELAGSIRSKEFNLKIEVQEIEANEIRARLEKFPLYGANPIGSNPRQRVMKSVFLTVRGKPIMVSESDLNDLFDPSLVYTLRVTVDGDQVVVAWAGGSGEREYRCRFYAVAGRFVRREISQLNNQSREVVTKKDL